MGFVLRAVEDLLEDPRDGDDHRRPYQCQLLLEMRDVSGKRHLDAPFDTDEGDGLGQRVCSGKKTRPTSSGSSIDRTASRFCTTFVHKLPWVIAQPLGRPVVPDV